MVSVGYQVMYVQRCTILYCSLTLHVLGNYIVGLISKFGQNMCEGKEVLSCGMIKVQVEYVEAGILL